MKNKRESYNGWQSNTEYVIAVITPSQVMQREMCGEAVNHVGPSTSSEAASTGLRKGFSLLPVSTMVGQLKVVEECPVDILFGNFGRSERDHFAKKANK